MELEGYSPPTRNDVINCASNNDASIVGVILKVDRWQARFVDNMHDRLAVAK